MLLAKYVAHLDDYSLPCEIQIIQEIIRNLATADLQIFLFLFFSFSFFPGRGKTFLFLRNYNNNNNMKKGACIEDSHDHACRGKGDFISRA